MEISQQGLDFIKSFEGLRLESYQDSAGVWTIGYGTTHGIKPGMRITKTEAEEMLRNDIAWFEKAVNTLLPIGLTQSEFDALASFCYNLGAAALETSTLRRRLLADEPRCWVYQKEMPRWNQAGGRVLKGLVRRRQAEADLACLGYLSEYAEELPEASEEEEKATFPLDVPYYTQLDSEVWGQAERSCFSSAMAMALEYVDPELMGGGDDWWLREVLKRGDTVSSTAQVETARAFGFDVEFRMDGTEQDLLDHLDRGIPVPIGILHKGHVDKPTGGGHYIVLIGYDEKYFYVNDPMGDLDLIGGGYPWAGRGKGEALKYTRKNTLKRWLIDGSGADGWWIFIKP